MSMAREVALPGPHTTEPAGPHSAVQAGWETRTLAQGGGDAPSPRSHYLGQVWRRRGAPPSAWSALGGPSLDTPQGGELL